MCYSGQCKWELRGIGEHAGECRKPRRAVCPWSEDYDPEEEEQEEARREAMLEEKWERDREDLADHIFKTLNLMNRVYAAGMKQGGSR